MILGVTGETRSLQRGPELRKELRKRVRRALDEGRRLNAETHFVQLGNTVFPIYLRSTRQGMGEFGSLGLSFGNVFKSIGNAITKAAKQVGGTPIHFVKRVAEEVKKHEKEIVGVGSAIVGGTLMATGVGAPLGLSIAGAGIGSTMGAKGQWGKPLQWGGGALIGGAAGYGAGAAITGSLLPTATGYGGIQAMGSGISSLFAPSAPTAAVAPAASAGMEIAPVATGGGALISPAAQAAAGAGGVFGTATDILKNAALLAPLIMGGGGAGTNVSMAPGGSQISPFGPIQPSPSLEPIGYGGGVYGGGSGGSSGGGGGGASASGEAAPGQTAIGPVTLDTKKANDAMPYIAAGLGAAAVVALAFVVFGRKQNERLDR